MKYKIIRAPVPKGTVLTSCGIPSHITCNEKRYSRRARSITRVSHNSRRRVSTKIIYLTPVRYLVSVVFFSFMKNIEKCLQQTFLHSNTFSKRATNEKYLQQTENSLSVSSVEDPPPSLPIKKEAKKQPPAIAVSGSGHTRKQSNSFDAVIHVQESPPHKRFLRVVGCNSNFMRLAQHLTALRAWCKQCLPGILSLIHI